MEAVVLLLGLDRLRNEGEEKERASVSLLELMRMEKRPKRGAEGGLGTSASLCLGLGLFLPVGILMALESP